MTGRGGHPYGAYFWAHPVETLPGTVAAGQSARGAPGGSTTHPGRGVPPSRSCVHRVGVESRVLLRSWPRVVAQPVSEPRLWQRFEPHPMELTDRRLQGRAPASVCGRIFLFCLTPPTCWQPSLDRLHFGRSLGSPTLGALQCSTPPPAPTATFPSPRRAAARTVVGNDVVLQHGAGSKRGPHALLSHFTCHR